MGTTVRKGFPAIKGVRWFNVAVLTITPAIGLYGVFHASARRETIIFSAAYFIFTMLGKCCSAWFSFRADSNGCLGITAGMPLSFILS